MHSSSAILCTKIRTYATLLVFGLLVADSCAMEHVQMAHRCLRVPLCVVVSKGDLCECGAGMAAMTSFSSSSAADLHALDLLGSCSGSGTSGTASSPSPRVPSPAGYVLHNNHVRRMPHRVSDSSSTDSPHLPPAALHQHQHPVAHQTPALQRTLDQLAQVLAPLSVSLLRVERHEQLSAAVDAMVRQTDVDAGADVGAGADAGKLAVAVGRRGSGGAGATSSARMTPAPVFVVSALTGRNLGLFTDFLSLLSKRVPARTLAIPTTPSASSSVLALARPPLPSALVNSASAERRASFAQSEGAKPTVFSVIQVFQGVDSDHSLPVLYGTLLK